jgi:lysophospholipase L1-like esterase
LSDGTFARNRPQANTLWLDDIFMSVPAIAHMGRFTGEIKYYNEAARQIKQFSQRMFLPERGLYRHGWVEGASSQPTFHWARANGWAILTLTEVLDVFPKNHPEYANILAQYRAHIQGIVNCQSGEGFWRQLLDRNDSYLETSATAIFVYCIARGINEGWIDPVVYGPVAQLGWHAVSTQINPQGQVEGTCVGTGMGFDPAFYYYRPVNKYAAHGYGPVLLAGAEMINLLNKFYSKMNDSALQYYTTKQTSTSPLFSVGAIIAGNSRISDKSPIVFTIGDSTMKNGSGKGDNKQWGWGTFFDFFVDTTRISVENHAIGGRSSRTFYTEGRWNRVLEAIRPGDFLIVQFGHNDGGPFNTGRARASIKGTGNESQTVIMERHGGPEEIFTFGHYMRIYIRQAKASGANVIVMSPTPGNSWDENNRMYRNNETYGKWSKEVAEQENVPYIDLNDRIAGKFEAMGKEAAKDYFIDRVHTSFDGAILNAKTAAENILQLENSDLKKYILPETLKRNYTENDINK